MLAYNDLKRAQYYFKYLRESEIKFKEEPDWREKQTKLLGKKPVVKKEIKAAERAISLDAEEEELF